MNLSLSMDKLGAWQARIQEPSLSILFTLQFLIIFLIAPVDVNFDGHYHWVTEIALTLMSLISVFIVVHRLARVFTLLSLALSLIGIVQGSALAHPHVAQPITVLSALLYTVTVSLVIGRKIFVAGPVTLHRIRGATTIYLNIAICFALVDSLLAAWVPHAFFSAVPDTGNDLGTMIYFSLMTLTSTGYGDIVPLHPYARSLASLESIVGQFYLGGLIATLIGLHVSYRQSSTGPPRPSSENQRS